MMATFKCWMYWAKLSKATVIKTYESQTCSNINWQVHGITNGKKNNVLIQRLFNIKYLLSLGLDIFKIKQVTVKRLTLNKINRFCQVFLIRQKTGEKASMENHLGEIFMTVSNIIFGKTLYGAKSYFKSTFLSNVLCFMSPVFTEC